MCLQGIKKQITDHLYQCEKLISRDQFDFVDRWDYQDIDDIRTNSLTQRNLNILQLNIRGLLTKQGQLNTIINNLETKISNLHRILLCETWLTEGTKKLIKFNNYHYIGREHENRKGGGIGFLVQKKLIIRERTNLCNSDQTFEHNIIELKCRKRNVLMVSAYRPPNTPIKNSKKCMKH